MSEIRVRPRQILIIVVVFLVILLFVHRNGKTSCIDLELLPQSLRAFSQNGDKPLRKIYAITPTYARPVQKAELTRLSNLFILVPNLHWILIEDSETTTSLVRNLLQRAGLLQRSTQLNVPTPAEFKLKGKDPKWSKARGVQQRNAALEWIRKNVEAESHGIVFFMDDDNTYSLELFAEMLKIENGRVGVWPVGLVGGMMVEKPILNEDKTKVVGFNAAWRPERQFPIDMAAFAISSDLFFQFSEAKFSYEVERGYQESEILRQVTTVDKLQPLANGCRDILVWHTRTEKPNLASEALLVKKGKPSDEGMEV